MWPPSLKILSGNWHQVAFITDTFECMQTHLEPLPRAWISGIWKITKDHQPISVKQDQRAANTRVFTA